MALRAAWEQGQACDYSFFEYAAQFKELVWPLSALKKVFVRKANAFRTAEREYNIFMRNENAEETNWCLASD